MSYPPQGHGPSGFQPYGQPPPGYGPYYGPRPPSTALAYLTSVLFVVLGALQLAVALVAWDGTSGNADLLVTLVGAAFSGDVTGNLDFAISVTMSVACSALTFGLLMLARLEVVRWLLAVLGALVTAYFVYAIIWLLSNNAGDHILLPLLAWVLWLVATVVAVLPATGRAMRGRANKIGYPQRY